MDGGIREKHKAEELKGRIRRHRKRSQTVSDRPLQSLSEAQRRLTDPGPARATPQQVPFILNASPVLAQSGDFEAHPSWTAQSAVALQDNIHTVDDIFLEDSFRAIVDFNRQPAVHKDASGPAVEQVENGSDIQWRDAPSPAVQDAASDFQDLVWADLAGSPTLLSPTHELGKGMADIHIHHDDLDDTTILIPRDPALPGEDMDHEQLESAANEHEENGIFEPITFSPLDWEHMNIFTDVNLHNTEMTVNPKPINEVSRECVAQSCAGTAQESLQATSAVNFFVQIILPNEFPFAGNTTMSHVREAILRPQEPVREFIHSTIETLVRCVQVRGLKRYGLDASTKHCIFSTADNLQLIDKMFASDVISSDNVIRTQCLEQVMIPLIQQAFYQVRDLR